MKFNLKSIGKNIGKDAMEVGLIMGGAIASRKFIDLDSLLKDQPADGFLRKHQGGIKAVAALSIAAALPANKKNDMIRSILFGVAIDGALREVRTLTTDDAGTSWFEQIGNINPDSEFPTGVSGANNEYVDLAQNSNTGVAGMGMNDDDDDKWD